VSVLRSPWMWRTARTWALGTWFAVISLVRLAWLLKLGAFAIDARIYIAGVRSWLDGGHPWEASVMFAGGPMHFAAPPPNLVPVVPLALLPGDLGAVALVLVCAAAAVATVRLLRLPLWWLLFPPITEGVMSGNPQIILTALLVVGGRASTLAPLLKVYAFIPLVLLGRYRRAFQAALIVAVASVVTLPLWPEYVASFGTASARLMLEASGGYSAWSTPVLLPIAAGAVAVLLWLDRPRGGWLAVPALWPASQFHYSTFYLPVADWWLAALFALPTQWAAPVGVILLTAVTLARRRKGRGPLPSIAAQPAGASD
jgi:hypothetical protein